MILSCELHFHIYPVLTLFLVARRASIRAMSLTNNGEIKANDSARPSPCLSLEARRRRLRYQSCYTSRRETDILLAGFVRECLPDMDAAGVASYEALLRLGDLAIWRMLAYGESPPAHLDRTALDALTAYMQNRQPPQ